MEIDKFLPKMGIVSVGEFKPTGKVVHDDAVDWDGTFTNMIDTNDKLELTIPSTTEQQTAGWENSTIPSGQEIYLEQGWEVISIQIYKYDSVSMTFRFRAVWDGADIGGSKTTTSTGWVTHTLSPSFKCTTTGKYYIRIDGGGAGKYFMTGNEGYRGGAYCYVAGDTPNRLESYDLGFKVTYNIRNGSYVHDTTPVDVGAGVDWGKFEWSEVLDGATIIAKVKTSPDGVDWSEEWQTLSNGDYITGNNRYLIYGYWVINGTLITEIDDVNIGYAV